MSVISQSPFERIVYVPTAKEVERKLSAASQLWKKVEESADLDERLDLTPLGNLLLAHPFCYFSWVAFDAGNNSVGVWSFLGALIELLDDDDLPPCLAPLQHDRNLLLTPRELCALISCGSDEHPEDDKMYLSRLVNWWKLRTHISRCYL